MRKNYPYKTVMFLAAGLMFLFMACSTTKTAVDSKDLSYIYNPLRVSINPRYSVFNKSDNESVLSVKFFTSDLYFTEANPSGVPMAMMFISVRLYNISMGRTLSDTAFYNLDIVKDGKREEYLYKIPLRIEKGMQYVADVKVMDKIRQVMVQAFVPFNTTSETNRYNFYAQGNFLKNELLQPVIRKDEYINLIYGRTRPDSLYISFYTDISDIPYPPSMVLPERPVPSEPDTIVAVLYSDTLPLMFPRKGIFFCTVGRELTEGYTFYNFGPNFPTLKTAEEMIEPLGYLASADEMEDMKNSEKPKMALDDFWLSCGGNVERARELIRIYYTRTLYANYYFTSSREGWRTDRGMIYILYGPPDKLYKSNDEESWGYKRPVVRSRWGSRYSVREEYLFFNFKKRENKFTDNEYSLSRSETVVSYWDQAVRAWRNGIVFRLDNPTDI